MKKNGPSCFSSHPHILGESTEGMSVPCFSIGAISSPCSTDIHIHVHLHVHVRVCVCALSSHAQPYDTALPGLQTILTIPQSHNRTSSATPIQPSKRT